MKIPPAFILTIVALLSFASSNTAHPGSGIVVDARGNVFVGDINRGLVKFSPDGKTTVVLREASHWLAVDKNKKFAGMDFQKSDHWPRWFKHRNPPASDLALISDGGSPLVVHRDGNLYFVCDDERHIPAGLQIARLSPNGKLGLLAPGLKAHVEKLGGIKGLASGPGDVLYAVTPGAVLKVQLDGTFTTLKEPVVPPDCDSSLPPNTPAAHQAFLTGVTVSEREEIYLAATGCRCVVKIDPNGRMTTILKAEAPWSPTGVALSGDDLYVAEWTNAHSEQHDFRPRVRKVGRDGRATLVGVVPE